MNPTNQEIRAKAVNKFILIYGVSLLLVGALAWFIFHIPVGVFKSAILDFKTQQEEENGLVKRVDGITVNLQHIAQADQAYLSSSNDIEKGNLQANLQEYQKNVNDALVAVKNDSTGLTSPVAKRSSYNYIIAYNSILAYRNTLTSLQKSLAEKGGDAAELLRVRGQLDACNSQMELYKALASAKPAVAPPPAGGGGGGSKVKEDALQKQLDQANLDLLACQKAKSGTVAPPPNNTFNLSEAAKAAVLFESGESLMDAASKTRNLLEKRGILSSAKTLLEKAQPSYSNPEKVKKDLLQIDVDLKRLSNMG